MSNIEKTIERVGMENLMVATHNGKFHLDELSSIALIESLMMLKDDYHDDVSVAIHRTRIPKEYELADIIIDVGGRYDGVKYFDHHQLDDPLVEDKASIMLVWDDVKDSLIAKMMNKYQDHNSRYWGDNSMVFKFVEEAITTKIIKPISDWDVGIIKDSDDVLSLQNVITAMTRNKEDISDAMFANAYSLVKTIMYHLLKDITIMTGEHHSIEAQLKEQTGAIRMVDSTIPWFPVLKDKYHEFEDLIILIQPITAGLNGWRLCSPTIHPASRTPRCKHPWPDHLDMNHRHPVRIGSKIYQFGGINKFGSMVCVFGTKEEALEVADYWLEHGTIAKVEQKPFIEPTAQIRVVDKPTAQPQLMPPVIDRGPDSPPDRDTYPIVEPTVNMAVFDQLRDALIISSIAGFPGHSVLPDTSESPTIVTRRKASKSKTSKNVKHSNPTKANASNHISFTDPDTTMWNDQVGYRDPSTKPKLVKLPESKRIITNEQTIRSISN